MKISCVKGVFVFFFLLSVVGVNVLGKTTDQLIEETEKLLGSAPKVVATLPKKETIKADGYCIERKIRSF